MDFKDAVKYEPKPKKAKRNFWNQDDEEMFLCCWEEFQWDLRKSQRNYHIFVQMAADMNDKFSPEEIRIKVKNFTQRCRNEKRKMGLPGEGPSQWKHYNRVHKIIDGDAANSNEMDEKVDCKYFLSTPDSLEITDQPEVILPVPLRVSQPLSSMSSMSSEMEFQFPRSRSARLKSAKRKRITILDDIKKQGEEHIVLLRQVVEENKILSQEIVNLLKEQKETDTKMLTILEKLVEKT